MVWKAPVRLVVRVWLKRVGVMLGETDQYICTHLHACGDFDERFRSRLPPRDGIRYGGKGRYHSLQELPKLTNPRITNHHI